MSPMILREPCLRCHAYDKSAIGSLIGAVSVSVDAGPDFAVHEQAEHTLLLSHTSMWLVGTLGMILGGWRWRSLLLKLERSAVCDPLTGLYNRRELMSHLDFTTAGAERYQTPLSLIMLDIDHFKDVNDSYGHQAGDEVLQTVARIMRDSVRSGDLLARYGGEEFTIVCPHTEGDGAIVIAERIRRAVMETPVAARTGKIPVTLSAGIATYPRHGSAEKLLKDADQALYEAKRSGRNRVCRAAPTEAQAD
jgi:diguanylate cyclase (GGDEF)-like protein